MSDNDDAELWKQMDEGFQKAVDDDKNVAAHAHVPRAELERHVREAHGVVAQTMPHVLDAVVEGAVVKLEVVKVIELDALGEARLRASHFRLHELGVGHQPTSEVAK